MRVEAHVSLEELKRIERQEKDAGRSKRLRIILLAIEGWTAPAIAMSVGLSRRIIQRWVYRYNEQGQYGLFLTSPVDQGWGQGQLPMTPSEDGSVSRGPLIRNCGSMMFTGRALVSHYSVVSWRSPHLKRWLIYGLRPMTGIGY